MQWWDSGNHSNGNSGNSNSGKGENRSSGNSCEANGGQRESRKRKLDSNVVDSSNGEISEINNYLWDKDKEGKETDVR